GHKVALCQGFGFARRNRLTMAMFKADMVCPVGACVMGLARRPDYVLDGANTLGRYNRTQPAAAITERAMRHFEPGRYVGLVTAPLDECHFDIDLAFMYGNPAQMARLIQAATYDEGGRFEVSVIPGAVCADTLVPPLQTGKCSLAFPCWGDRRHTGTNDSEMIFTIPAARFSEIARGLADSHEHGMTLPVTLPTTYEAASPERYEQYRRDIGLP
ncbi:MAG: DUF169 domain-containing protein, partial [Chloroflexota bacterium]